MNYLEFIHQKPVLYGSTTGKNNRQYIGSYEVAFNKYSNKLDYFFRSEKGRLNKNMGFTVGRAFALYESGRLSFDPEKGKPENYISYK